MYVCVGTITNGIDAKLIRAANGFLHGIRVSWSWLTNVSTDCLSSPEVELQSGNGHRLRTSEGISVTNRNNSVDFFNLDCNQMYTPRVRVTYAEYYGLSENGNTLFFEGTQQSKSEPMINSE